MDAENNKAKFVIKIAPVTLAFFDDFGSSEIIKNDLPANSGSNEPIFKSIAGCVSLYLIYFNKVISPVFLNFLPSENVTSKV